MRPVRTVDDHLRQRIIHRHECIAVTTNAFFIAKSFFNSLAKHDADVFCCVVIIDMGVPIRFNIAIEQAVLDEQVQHMVHEWHPCIDIRLPFSIE